MVKLILKSPYIKSNGGVGGYLNFKPPSVMLSVSKLLHHMGEIFQEESFPKTGHAGIQIDRKRMERLQEKREAHGLKGNMYEEYKGPTMGGMSM